MPYARVAIANIQREYPTSISYWLDAPGQLLPPRELHPAFWGSLDWHSCVEMHWILVRVLRLFPKIAIAAEVRATLDEDLSAEKLAVEARYIDAHRGFERPYGWGWALMLANDLALWDDLEGARWRENMAPLSEAIVARFLDWLPKATYPLRVGLHGNSAFGLSLALPFARTRDDLRVAFRQAALRWFAHDRDYPASWEPSGADFLSPALTEADLMRGLLERDMFVRWFDTFLPGVPRSLLEPAVISDPTDGQIAHLHGLNLSRAYCMRRITDALAPDDARRIAMERSMERHADASLGAAVGGDYMVEHWLPAFALLYLSE